MTRIAVIGAGTIGASWAAHFLAQGLDVQAWDPAPDAEARTRKFVDDVWPVLQRLGTASDADQKRLTWHPDPASAIEGVQFVQESAPERQDVKQSLYESFDDALPSDAVMASSSSSLLISELQAGRVGRERYVLGHPFNPPHLVPLVEVLGGRDTDASVVDWTLAFYQVWGKQPIRLNKEVPGHLVTIPTLQPWRDCAAQQRDARAPRHC
ncbi:MAG: 3-hydroxyacyl-CoA dehydrogenase NAD-binding domain-containing protein [Dehalococcoidia bacterium]